MAVISERKGLVPGPKLTSELTKDELLHFGTNGRTPILISRKSFEIGKKLDVPIEMHGQGTEPYSIDGFDGFDRWVSIVRD